MAITKTIYMAGNISYYHKTNQYFKATEWRSRLIDQLLDDIAINCESKWNWFDPTLNFENNVIAVNNKSVLHQNNYYLDTSDIMVVNLAELDKSPGTIYEIIYYGLKGKPIIGFNYENSPFVKSPHIEPFITILLKEDKIMKYLDSMYYQ